MSQLAMNFEASAFVRTRARATDCDTSLQAAKNAVTGKADAERKAITQAVKTSPIGMTGREVSECLMMDYFTVQRRISECGLTKTDQRRDGCAVWVAV